MCFCVCVDPLLDRKSSKRTLSVDFVACKRARQNPIVPVAPQLVFPTNVNDLIDVLSEPVPNNEAIAVSNVDVFGFPAETAVVQPEQGSLVMPESTSRSPERLQLDRLDETQASHHVGISPLNGYAPLAPIDVATSYSLDPNSFASPNPLRGLHVDFPTAALGPTDRQISESDSTFEGNSPVFTDSSLNQPVRPVPFASQVVSTTQMSFPNTCSTSSDSPPPPPPRLPNRLKSAHRRSSKPSCQPRSGMISSNIALDVSKFGTAHKVSSQCVEGVAFVWTAREVCRQNGRTNRVNLVLEESAEIYWYLRFTPETGKNLTTSRSNTLE